jgi:hypothetical protein
MPNASPATPKGRYRHAHCAGINGWLRVLRVITAAAAADLELPRDPIAAVKDIDTSAHRTYSDEAPNSLRPEDVPRFLGTMLQRYPQRFAMVVLGFVTGLRPSSLRPLRRCGSM